MFRLFIAAENDLDGKKLPKSCADVLAIESDDLYMSIERDI